MANALAALLKASVYCPHCRKHTALTLARTENGTPAYAWPERDFGAGELAFTQNLQTAAQFTYWLGTCNACLRTVMVWGLGRKVWPSAGYEPTAESVPERIRIILDEAKAALTAGLPNAAAILAGRAIEEACEDKHATGQNLHAMIRDLGTKQLITLPLVRAADAVRLVRNEGAHSGHPLVSVEDAERVVSLADVLLDALYVHEATADAILKPRGR